MNKFFVIQNIILLAAIVAVTWAGITYLDTFAPAIGMFVATMLVAGTGSFGYAFDQRTDKEDLWIQQWFKKDYLIEICATFISAAFFFAMSLLIWTTFWRFMSGAAVTLTIIYIWEWLYSRVIKKWY